VDPIRHVAAVDEEQLTSRKAVVAANRRYAPLCIICRRPRFDIWGLNQKGFTDDDSSFLMTHQRREGQDSRDLVGKP